MCIRDSTPSTMSDAEMALALRAAYRAKYPDRDPWRPTDREIALWLYEVVAADLLEDPDLTDETRKELIDNRERVRVMEQLRA